MVNHIITLFINVTIVTIATIVIGDTTVTRRLHFINVTIVTIATIVTGDTTVTRRWNDEKCDTPCLTRYSFVSCQGIFMPVRE